MKTRSSLLIAVFFVACSPAPGCLPSEKDPRYCVQTSDCKDPAFPVCDVPAKECVSAIAPGDLGQDLSDTDIAMADLLEPDLLPPPDLMPECTQATFTTACAADEPICDTTSQTCRACSGTGDDSSCLLRSATQPYCLMSSGACVACREDAHCTTATQPVCELVATGSMRNTCRPCAKHDECPSMLCNPDGSCEPSANLVYVNNRTPDDTAACTGTSHAGTIADPYCQIADGIAALAGSKTIVRVLGSTDDYKAVALTSLPVASARIIGPGSAAAKSATVYEGTIIFFSFAPSSGTAALTIEGVTFGKTSDPSTKRGVVCSGASATASLNLRDVTVQRAGAEGVFVDTCAVTISQSTIIGNAGGLVINSADYNIVNNLIAKNTATGVVFSNTDPPLAASRFWFNTVVSNGALNTRGGLNCASLSSGTRPIQNSIIALNARNMDVGGTQVTGDCEFTSIVAGAAEGSSATGLIKTDPPLVDSSSTATAPSALRVAFSLASTDTTVCVDQLDAVAGFPSIDLFGTSRPQGTKFDIGMHELKK